MKRLLQSLGLIAAAIPCLAHASDLEFGGVRFDLKAVKDSPSMTRKDVNITFYQYAAVGENKNQCSVSIRRWPGDSDVHGTLMVDAGVFRPPIIIAPNQLVKASSPKYADDAAMVILAQNLEDKSKFVIYLHRATAIPDWGLREMRVQCTMSYTGFFGNSTSAFDDVKQAWVGNLFALDPELPSQMPQQGAQPAAR